MLDVRVIPVLLLRRHGLVKTVRFRDARYVGDPINVVRIFNQKEVDEILLTEVVATKEGRGPDFDLLEQIASEAFMPVCYGGGVRSVDDAKRVLRLGMEKVSVNTAALDRPEIVRELADSLGAQCVVASVDVKRTWRGAYEVHSHAGRRVPERDPLRWVERLVGLGAGEVLLNAVHRDGTMQGCDLALLERFRDRFDVPIIACGGVGSVTDMKTAVRAGGLSAIGVGARFIYEGPYRAVLVSYLSPKELAEVQRVGAAPAGP
ncbi:MAG: AglZ/HisF2 family acetamidino modification protein [Labilithrix sp.]|nr:AglZ/HisF2 family acetamidino modification protein [Labilithrix sp.]MCW5832796.1 AglZ/HisF2 family acetamidino modification protein [Labilithrix sp.]